MLAVDKDYRKLKIGTTLVQKAIRVMIANQADEVVLETEITNQPALKLYENLGFVHLREIEQDLGGIKIKYVLFNSGNNDFRVQCVPVKEGSFVCRKFLHKSWFGIRDAELEKVSGIEGIKFCHSTGFIGGHNTRDGTLKMAELSLLAED